MKSTQAKFRLIQIAPGVNYGDAISNDMAYIKKSLHSGTYHTHFSNDLILAENIGPGMQNFARKVDSYQPESKDIILLHYGITAKFMHRLLQWSNPIYLVYHNITPHHFFLPYNLSLAGKLLRSRLLLHRLRSIVRASFADSHFNALELERMGFDSVFVRPLAIPSPDPRALPCDANPINPGGTSTSDVNNTPGVKQPSSRQNEYKILCVGRIAPNKGYSHLLKSFYHLCQLLPGVRLDLVGSAMSEIPTYETHLHQLIDTLGIKKNVHWHGHVSDRKLMQHYEAAHLFTIFSEHEGFCKPLLEAMQAGIPVITYSDGRQASKETLGDAGIAFDCFDYPRIAALMKIVLTDTALRQRLLERQFQRLQSYDSNKACHAMFNHILESCP